MVRNVVVITSKSHLWQNWETPLIQLVFNMFLYRSVHIRPALPPSSRPHCITMEIRTCTVCVPVSVCACVTERENRTIDSLPSHRPCCEQSHSSINYRGVFQTQFLMAQTDYQLFPCSTIVAEILQMENLTKPKTTLLINGNKVADTAPLRHAGLVTSNLPHTSVCTFGKYCQHT